MDYVMEAEQRQKFLEDVEGRIDQLEQNVAEAYRGDEDKESIHRLKGRIEELERLKAKLEEDKLYEYYQR